MLLLFFACCAFQRCLVARKGFPLEPGQAMGPEHVWWCVQPSGSRAVVAAQIDPRTGQLRELPLPRCLEVWGWDPLREGSKSASSDEEDLAPSGSAKGGCGGTDSGRPQPSNRRSSSATGSAWGVASGASRGLSDEAVEKLLSANGDAVVVQGVGGDVTVRLPKVPPKFVKWLRARQKLSREVANMASLGPHPNVVQLLEVLEYVQDSKSTLFLALELAAGGELFDRIQAMGQQGSPAGRLENSATAQRYFAQLVRGVAFCHAKGVAHRDLVGLAWAFGVGSGVRPLSF